MTYYSWYNLVVPRITKTGVEFHPNVVSAVLGTGLYSWWKEIQSRNSRHHFYKIQIKSFGTSTSQSGGDELKVTLQTTVHRGKVIYYFDFDQELRPDLYNQCVWHIKTSTKAANATVIYSSNHKEIGQSPWTETEKDWRNERSIK